jgi:uncharacterized protein
LITSLYSAILAMLYFYISLETIKARGREKVSLGPGGDNQILHLVSAHSNFASYVPIFLLMLFLLELQQINKYLLHGIAIVFLVGRVLHFLTMRDKERTFKKRKLGMQMTLWPLIVLACLNLFAFIRATVSV